MQVKLTVFFAAPFWVGVFERSDQGEYEAARVVFGAEPKDYEIYAYINERYFELQFSPVLSEVADKAISRINPKRLKRKIASELQSKGIGTKAQQALRLQYETAKAAQQQQKKLKHEAEAAEKFRLKQQKKKEKHKGH